MVILDYVERRITQTPPGDCCVVPGSTPVISFGDVRTARVATVGINPSFVEFSGGHIPLAARGRSLFAEPAYSGSLAMSD